MSVESPANELGMSPDNVKLRDKLNLALEEGRIDLRSFAKAINDYKTTRNQGGLEAERAKDLDEKISIGEDILEKAAQKEAAKQK